MELVLTSIIAFISTNIDDIFILMLFFANKEYNRRQVVFGQFAGISALIAISVVGSLIGLLVEQKYIGLLGLLPVYLGVRSIIKALNRKSESLIDQAGRSQRTQGSWLSVAAVTFANGGDNIGIYIPFFATLTPVQKSITIVIFFVMVAIWCLVAGYLSHHPIVAKNIEKYGHLITPVILILLGIYILYESGTFYLI